jgi:hypothetical protein
MTVTLKATHLVNEGSYLIQRSHTSASLEVDGIPVTANTFVVSDPTTILSVRVFQPAVTHYENETGSTLSVESYMEQKSDLASKGTPEEGYSSCYIFENLDDEFAYKRFLKTWEPVFGESRTEKDPVKLEVVEVRTNSGDPDIQSMWNSPQCATKAHLYTLDRNAISLRDFKACCEAHGLDYNIPSHSGIRFAKIDGKYAGFDDMDFSKSPPFIGTLDQCKAEKLSLYKRVTNTIKLYIAKYRTKPALKNAAEVLSDLDAIRVMVQKATPMKASRDNHTAALAAINKLQTSVRREILD